MRARAFRSDYNKYCGLERIATIAVVDNARFGHYSFYYLFDNGSLFYLARDLGFRFGSGSVGLIVLSCGDGSANLVKSAGWWPCGLFNGHVA